MVASTINVLYGDAVAMYDDARGGNDTLIGGASAVNVLIGDADDHVRQRPRRQRHADRRRWCVQLPGRRLVMYGDARGGNDTLIGGAGAMQLLPGDASDMSATAAAATTR